MYRGTTFCKIEPPPQDNYSKAYQSKTSNHYAKETTLLILLCSAKEMLEDASMLGRIDRDLEPDTLSNQLTNLTLCVDYPQQIVKDLLKAFATQPSHQQAQSGSVPVAPAPKKDERPQHGPRNRTGRPSARAAPRPHIKIRKP